MIELSVPAMQRKPVHLGWTLHPGRLILKAFFAVMVGLLLAGPIAADYQTGLDAYRIGDYKVAKAEWLAAVSKPYEEVDLATYAETLYAIAMLYWKGEGVSQDYQEAYEWLTKAGSKKHAGASAKLGFLYADGGVIEQNYDKAFFWYKQSARAGDIDGQYNLGVFYYYGLGTEQDITMAAQYLAAAAAQGDNESEVALQQVMSEIREGNDSPAGRVAAPAPLIQISEPNAGLVSEILAIDWIMIQDPDRYTIQVIALSSYDKLMALIEGYEEHYPFATYTVERNEQSLFVLVQGNYANVDQARRARDYFPKNIQQTDKLWIRQFGMIQSQLIDQ